MSLSQALNQFAQNLGRYRLISEVSQFWFNTLFKTLSFLDVVLSVIFTVYVIKELRASRPSDDDERGEHGECVDKPKSEIQS